MRGGVMARALSEAGHIRKLRPPRPARRQAAKPPGPPASGKAISLPHPLAGGARDLLSREAKLVAAGRAGQSGPLRAVYP